MTLQCIIVGSGHAAATLATELRSQGWSGNILLIGEESQLPYQRPPLSKTVLTGEKSIEDVLLRPAATYDKADVSVLLGQRVISIDRKRKAVMLSNGDSLCYDKLALCTGARPRCITIPGHDLQGIHYLRQFSDVVEIRKQIKTGVKAVIIGGGYIGLEAAASLRKQDVEVTLLELAPRVLSRVTAQEVSTFYSRVHTDEGVNIHCDTAVSELVGLNGKVQQVICEDGSSHAADLLIVGVGVLPNIELAADAGLNTGNGILVDEFACTNDPDIVAAGDCTFHPNSMLKCSLRLESVPNAVEQAKSAAASICGNSRRHCSLPWFWSDQYDLKLQIAGFNQGYDKVIVRGDALSSRSFVAFYLREGKLIAADCINRPKEFMLSKRALTEELPVNIDLLADDSLDPKLLFGS